jgi:Xaa-Pro aminopeptidase
VKRLSLIALLILPFKLEAQFTAREYAQRREMLASRVPDAVIVAFGAREPAQDYLEFSQNPGMLYLSGIKEPDAALVMVKESGKASATVFVLPRDPAAETWTGRRMGRDGAARLTGLPARDRESLTHVLDSLGAGKLPFYVIGEMSDSRDADAAIPLTPDEQYVAALKSRHPQLRVASGADLLAQLRGKKTPAELALIKRAVDITVSAQKEAIAAVRPESYEYEIEALIEYVFRRNGSERPSFATIVGSGPNSTTLHYNVDDRQIQRGDVVVMDIGASYQGYAADVTRTVPASGTFSPEQRQIYQIVRDAQAAAERQAKLGAAAQLMSDSADAVIAAGLARLGLIESPNATFESSRGGAQPQLHLYYMHGLGHGIGLEVHDPDQFYFTGTIGEGSAFTIEPGIYVRENLLETIADTPKNRAMIAKIRTAVERYKNIGVRIEDDYIVTDKGVEWISRAPREIAEIEALMRRATP